MGPTAVDVPYNNIYPPIYLPSFIAQSVVNTTWEQEVAGLVPEDWW